MKLKVGANLGQLGLAFALILFIFVSIFSYRTLIELSDSLNQVHLAQETLDKMIEFHADFLLKPEFEKITEGAQLISEAKHSINLLSNLSDFGSYVYHEHRQTLKEIDVYSKKFERLTKLIQTIGFTEEQGLRSQFRTAAHRLQDFSIGLNNDSMTIAILELRRREKDFLLRKNPRYLALHTQEFLTLKSLLKQQTEEKGLKLSHRYLSEYEHAFTELVIAQKEIGLSPQQGLIADIRALDKTLFQNVSVISKKLSAEIIKSSSQSLVLVSIVMFSLLLVSMGFIRWLLQRTYKGLLTLSKQIHHIVKTEDYTARLDNSNENEFDVINKDLNRLIAHFEQTLANLSTTTDKLIESEKMAFVGNMVAGVAHELNTPLGIIVTSESYIRNNIERLQSALESGKLQRSELESLLVNSSASLELIESNLQRTSTLIETFKSVSSQHTYDELTEFKLADLVDAIKMAVSREVTKTNCQLNFEICDIDVIRSYYSALTQILNILLVNAFRHATVPGRQLQVNCRFTKQNHYMMIIISDNGSGISSDALPHVFEPFFTTKRNHGGTGLGLSVLYSIVTQTFKGEVSVQNNEQGCSFVCRLPFTANTLHIYPE